MTQILGRILLILAIAAIIAGGIYMFVQNSGSSTSNFRSESQFANPGATTGSQLQQFREHDRFEGGASIGRGFAGVIGNLLEISVITLLVIILRGWLGSARRVGQPV
jgi:hypothetical protein